MMGDKDGTIVVEEMQIQGRLKVCCETKVEPR